MRWGRSVLLEGNKAFSDVISVCIQMSSEVDNIFDEREVNPNLLFLIKTHNSFATEENDHARR